MSLTVSAFEDGPKRWIAPRAIKTTSVVHDQEDAAKPITKEN
jgi:hypothetical protein